MLNKPIQLYEFDAYDLAKQDITLTETDISHIERLNKNARKLHKIKRDLIKLSPDRYQPTQLVAPSSLVGVVKAGRNTIQILPKIVGWDSRADYAEQFIKNLLSMLNFTKKLAVNVKEIDTASLGRVKDDFFEVLILLFARHLLELLEQEMHKEYIEMEANLPYIKGRLKIDEHVRRNFVVKNHFFVRFDELLEDNLLNQILKYTVNGLLKQSSNFDNKKLLQEISFLLSEISLKMINLSHFEKVHLSRLNDKYAPILNLCQLFVGQSSIELRPDKTTTFSFVFDMNVLFEEFIGEFIKRHFSDRFEKIKLQQSSSYLVKSVYDGTTISTKPRYSLKPDIVFYKEKKAKKPALLLDTKYKKLDFSGSMYGVKPGDMYQMCAYSLKYECPDVILLYPQIGEKSERYSLIVNEDTRVHVRTVDLMRDLRASEGIKELKEELKDILTVPEFNGSDLVESTVEGYIIRV